MSRGSSWIDDVKKGCFSRGLCWAAMYPIVPYCTHILPLYDFSPLSQVVFYNQNICWRLADELQPLKALHLQRARQRARAFSQRWEVQDEPSLEPSLKSAKSAPIGPITQGGVLWHLWNLRWWSNDDGFGNLFGIRFADFGWSWATYPWLIQGDCLQVPPLNPVKACHHETVQISGVVVISILCQAPPSVGPRCVGMTCGVLEDDVAILILPKGCRWYVLALCGFNMF